MTMAFDEALADRIREVLADVPDLGERLMFGGIAFMVGEHMACGVIGDELAVRLGPEGAATALEGPHVRPMDFTGRPMRTMVLVAPAGVGSDADLARWVGAARAFVRTLPPRRRRSSRPRD
jgi:hypothetical protein